MVMRGHLDLQHLTDLGLNDIKQARQEELNNIGLNAVRTERRKWLKSPAKKKDSNGTSTVFPWSSFDKDFENSSSNQPISEGAVRRNKPAALNDGHNDDPMEKAAEVQDEIKVLPPIKPRRKSLNHARYVTQDSVSDPKRNLNFAAWAVNVSKTAQSAEERMEGEKRVLLSWQLIRKDQRRFLDNAWFKAGPVR